MEDFYTRIQIQHQKNLPFVVYNKPNSSKLIGFFQTNDTLYSTEHFNESGFVLAPFHGGKVVLIPNAHSDLMAAEWTPKPNPTDQSSAAPSENQGKTEFENLVAKGIQAIQDGEFQKVVLSRKEEVLLSGFDAATAFEYLINAYPAAFTYCFFHPQIGIWLGASPEQLLKVQSGQFETTALAGTKAFSGNEAVDWEHKEKEEQQFVTDFILENLENVTSDIAFSNPYTYRAGNLLHIKTDISGTVSADSNVRQLLDILHPTPAVCGLPKEAAREFILENEGYDRKYYTGYLGELNADIYHDQNTTDLFVNLRCMEIIGEVASIYIGCGVTKDSIPEKEYIETVNKSMTIKKIIL